MQSIQETYRSSSRPRDYFTGVDSKSGLLSCTCPGWINKREGMPRWCDHCRKFTEAHPELKFEERDEQYFLVSKASPKRMVLAPRPAPKMTAFIQPMKAIKIPDGWDADRYRGGDWAMEEKFDGHRLIVQAAFAGRGKGMSISAWSGGEKQRTLPVQIHDAMTNMPPGIYDGELIVPGMHSYDVTAGMNSGKEVLILFDILETIAHSTTHLPYKERRQLLAEAFKLCMPERSWLINPRSGPVQLIRTMTPLQKSVERIWKRGGEGVILKHVESTYQPGYRSDQWIKIKAVASAVFTVIGYEKGKVGDYSAVQIQDSEGIVTTVKTLDNATMREIAAAPRKFLGRKLVISYQERTPNGKYRHPMWDHWAGKGER